MRAVSLVGIGLSAAAGALDLFSGYSILQSGSGMMLGGDAPAALGLLALGAIVIGTGVMMAIPREVERMSTFGLLMAIYGIVMGLVPIFVSSMNPALGNGMRLAGALMIVDGAIMFYARAPMMV